MDPSAVDGNFSQRHEKIAGISQNRRIQISHENCKKVAEIGQYFVKMDSSVGRCRYLVEIPRKLWKLANIAEMLPNQLQYSMKIMEIKIMAIKINGN